jgi:DNA-directed RNA polymerase specialized sigma24 family protein
MAVIDEAASEMPVLDEVDLYKRCSVVAFRAARAVLPSNEQARDIAADSYLELLSALREGAKVKTSPEQYVRKIAFRKAVKERRRLEPLAELDQEVMESLAGGVEPKARLSAMIRAVAERLTAGQATAIELIHGEDLSGDEAGEVMGISRRAAYEQARVGRRKLERGLVEWICRRPGAPAGCAERGWSIYELRLGTLEANLRSELEAHLESCAYCRESQSEVARMRQQTSLAPLFPADQMLEHKDDILRRAAARQAAGSAPAPQTSPWRLRLSVAVAITGIVAVIGLPGLVNHPPVQRAAPVAAVASPTVPPSPTPPPPPPAPNGGFAYIKNGDIYYQSDFAAAPVQLTNTGGLVDDFHWTAGGRSILYKQRAPRSQGGDLYQVDLLSRQVTWSYQVGAAAFAVSPDGASYAAVIASQIGSGYNSQFSYRLLIGNVGSNPDPTREVDLSTSSSAAVVGYLTEYPPVNSRANAAGVEIWWTSAGIHLEPFVANAGFDINPNTKAVVERSLNNVFDADRVYSGPAISQIQDVFGNLQVSSGGATRNIDFRGTHGPVMILSVSADESRGLATVLRSDGGHDVYLVTANGDVTPLSTDGSTLLAAWQPATTQ